MLWISAERGLFAVAVGGSAPRREARPLPLPSHPRPLLDVVAADGAANQEELRLLEMFRHRVGIGRLPAVQPRLTGSAWVLGRAEWSLDPTDPLGSAGW